MAIAALVIAIISLVLAGVAYWRSGGQRDVQRLDSQLQRQLDALQVKQAELVDHAAQSLAAAYERSRRRLQHVRGRLHDLQVAAEEGLEAQRRRAAEHLEALSQRLEHSAAAAKEATLSAARQAEAGVARRVHRVHARVLILEVKGKATLARRAASADEYDRADTRLTEAMELLGEVRTVLRDDDAYDPQLDSLKAALREAVRAVRTRAEDTRRRIEHVLTDADEVIARLESDELGAAESTKELSRT
ncbi:MAG: hypothetical protein AB1679_01865 [Actinomycetota bacterium]|jgi:hypothetical protein